MDYQTEDLLRHGRCPRCGSKNIMRDIDSFYCLEPTEPPSITKYCLYHFSKAEVKLYNSYCKINNVSPVVPENCLGTKRRGRARALSPEDEQRAFNMIYDLKDDYQAITKLCKAVGEEFDCSYKAIQNILDRRGRYLAINDKKRIFVCIKTN